MFGGGGGQDERSRFGNSLSLEVALSIHNNFHEFWFLNLSILCQVIFLYRWQVFHTLVFLHSWLRLKFWSRLRIRMRCFQISPN